MKILLSIIYVIFASITAGYCLSCIECESNGKDCIGPAQTCLSPSDICMSYYSETSTNTGVVKYLSRFCGSSRNCNQYRSLTAINWHQESISTCCKSDSCTPDFPTLPPVNTSLNGLQCPSCISWQSHSCVPMSTVKCAGQETRCVTAYQTRAWTFAPKTNYIASIAGCCTENLCNYGSSSYFSDIVTHVDASCTDNK